MAGQPRTRIDDGDDDSFLLNYTADELRTASEFFANWIPFLSRGLCRSCARTISDRVRSLDHVLGEAGKDVICTKQKEDVGASTLGNKDLTGYWGKTNSDTYSIGSWNNASDINDHDHADTHSLGSWKEEGDGSPEHLFEPSTPAGFCMDEPSQTSGGGGGCLKSEKLSTPLLRGTKMSWADMAQEDELGTEQGSGSSSHLQNTKSLSREEGASGDESNKLKTELSTEQGEYIRFCNVKRMKDFICLERINGKIVNILDGLELHTGVFSAADQIRIVDYVETLNKMGNHGESKETSYTAPENCMDGRGRGTFQFGWCHNYATDKNGDPPGILKDDNTLDPIPPLLKDMIKRLVKWHVIPPNSIPDSCVVNIYEEGDCIPPRIENQDFLRPFCIVSFLSECDMVFGSNPKVLGPGKFDGPTAISLPVGSVLVLNGKGADVAKHCLQAVSAKRILITFRKMAESKRPLGYVPDPDLQGLQPISYEVDKSKKSKTPRQRRQHNHDMKKHSVGLEDNVRGNRRRPVERGFVEPRHSLGQAQQRNNPRVVVDLEKSADHSYRRTVKFDRHLP
ncbi:unnamed protein product [Cuscuta campestris]|uniref:Uncharacterized protein n=1 Tax=Cuscuta campestris TaxID=132261 RepID=A0A484MY32_9ASTE|nr:unnamed protein product [Cuscuta campestris]